MTKPLDLGTKYAICIQREIGIKELREFGVNETCELHIMNKSVYKGGLYTWSFGAPSDDSHAYTTSFP